MTRDHRIIRNLVRAFREHHPSPEAWEAELSRLEEIAQTLDPAAPRRLVYTGSLPEQQRERVIAALGVTTNPDQWRVE